MQRLLTEAVAQLNPRERQLFEMRHAADLSTEEIAEQTGIPKTSVAAMVSAARRKVIIALRIILSTAAIYLAGLYLWLQQEPTEPVRKGAKVQPEVREAAPCTEGGALELYECYMEQKKKQPHTYSILKQRINGNQK